MIFILMKKSTKKNKVNKMIDQIQNSNTYHIIFVRFNMIFMIFLKYYIN